MAGKLAISARLVYDKNGANTRRSEGISVDVAGDSFTHEIQSVGTSEEELAQGVDLGTPGYVYLKNLDGTNFVEIGSTTGVYDVKMLAGEIALYRHNSASIFAKADTAACLVEYTIIEL
ncbi:hypothetical protein LCGC14_1653560 [marine sediment metagenome]|uniref:Uncharacterized protein n=1 Tax=marine sediment metagenome TaxID=412755 RepID=A0A0F9HW71_9ZZZZ